MANWTGANGFDVDGFRIDEIKSLDYHGNGLPSRKNPPVGPLSGSVAAQIMLAAPSATLRGAPAPPISVATQPGQTEFTRMRALRSSAARVRVIAFSAAFVTWYAGGPAPMLASDPDSDETLTMRAERLFLSSGRNAWQTRQGPIRFVVIVSRTVPLMSAFSTVSHVS